MHYEITSALLGHTLLGTVLAIAALATGFWLLLAFRTARAAMLELSALDRSLQADRAPQLNARAL